jgi:hypothetical protein
LNPAVVVLAVAEFLRDRLRGVESTPGEEEK